VKGIIPIWKSELSYLFYILHRIIIISCMLDCLILTLFSFECFTVATMTWSSVMEYMCYIIIQVCSVCRNLNPAFPHSWLVTAFVTSVIPQMHISEQELQTLPEHLGSHPLFVGFVFINLWGSVQCFKSHCLSFFFWPLYCLSFDLRLLFTSLISLNFSVIYTISEIGYLSIKQMIR